MSLPLPIKQQITSSLFGKDTTWRFWRVNWILRVHMHRPAELTNSKDKLLLRHVDSLTKSNIKIDLPTFYWLPKLQKNPFISRFISNSSHCSTTILSKHITSSLTAVKYHGIKYSETAFSKCLAIVMWIIFGPLESLPRSSKSYFQSSQVSSFDFSTLYCYTHILFTWSYQRKGVVSC